MTGLYEDDEPTDRIPSAPKTWSCPHMSMQGPLISAPRFWCGCVPTDTPVTGWPWPR